MKYFLLLLTVPLVAQGPEGPQCAIATPACGGGGNQLCSTQTSSNTLTQGGSNCGTFPSGYSVYRTWLIQLINTVNHAVTAQTSSTVSGTGWCAGLACNVGTLTPASIRLTCSRIAIWFRQGAHRQFSRGMRKSIALPLVERCKALAAHMQSRPINLSRP